MDNPSQIPLVSDHDLLIRLDTKMTQLSEDVKDVKNGTTASIAILQAKIVAYDQILAEYPVKDLTQMLMRHEKWINDFKITWKIILTLAIGIGSLITFLTTIILNSAKILNLPIR